MLNIISHFPLLLAVIIHTYIFKTQCVTTGVPSCKEIIVKKEKKKKKTLDKTDFCD